MRHYPFSYNGFTLLLKLEASTVKYQGHQLSRRQYESRPEGTYMLNDQALYQRLNCFNHHHQSSEVSVLTIITRPSVYLLQNSKKLEKKYISFHIDLVEKTDVIKRFFHFILHHQNIPANTFKYIHHSQTVSTESTTQIRKCAKMLCQHTHILIENTSLPIKVRQKQ